MYKMVFFNNSVYLITSMDFPTIAKILKAIFYILYFLSLFKLFTIKDKNMKNVLLFSILGFMSYYIFIDFVL